MTRLLVLTLAFCCLLAASGNVQHNNNLRHQGKSLGVPAVEDWNYKLQGGDWMSEGDCSKTDRQSPIDIESSKTDVSTDALSVMWAIPKRLPLTNDGRTLTVTLPSDGPSGMVFRGHPYRLSSFHFHGPSEHTFDGDSRDLEVHFVHQSIEDPTKYAYIALTYSDDHSEPTAPSDPFLRALINAELPKVGGEATEIRLPSDTHGLLDWQGEFFHYLGSLTTPPCTQSVSWFVQRRPIAAPLAELQRVQELFRYEGTRGNWRKTVNGQNIQKVARVTLLEPMEYLVNKGHSTKPSDQPAESVATPAPTAAPTPAPSVAPLDSDLVAAAKAASQEPISSESLVKHHTAHKVEHVRALVQAHVHEQERAHGQGRVKRHHVVRDDRDD